ncbi:holo-ACP synthase [Bacillus sp. 165]|uniref:holo-ACP synthase n=1 Tax=Bacillus sp. 165 TaxID=1529117 RepID=UPI001ADC532F|nr:holo-ACP synthase [Bacillus sp. 165]MBO9131381.1 holo-ACP synthase [Bacillus sp. 165]
MIIGTGIDIVELKRIADLLDRQPKFIDRILTAKEKEYFGLLQGKRKVEFAAGRFAVKEAYSKAIGTGIGQEVSFLDIEIINDERGKPVLTGGTDHIVHVSISHSNEFAVAQVIIESSSC